MGVSSSSNGIRNKHTIQPRVNNSITGTEGYSSTGTDKVWESVVSYNINWLGVCCCMAETLHNQVSAESQTCQRTQFVSGHGTSGILTSNCGHDRFTVLTRNNSISSTCLSNHFLSKSESLRLMLWFFRQIEGIRNAGITTKGLTCLRCDSTSNNQWNTSSGPDFIQNNGSLELKGANNLVSSSLAYLTLIRININSIAGIQVINIHLNGQRSGVFHSVEENRGNLSSNAHSSTLDIGHVRNIITHVP
mmetsp:Transcript_29675/g.45391  ORF Transcript_29675/g.45391 Transcript_29675/m.45391 type:complete len:248 (-) Transcript_29675:1151-1894(-)